MAKAASPIRLQQELMQAAESTAKRYHRSTAEQIEYWADLGRSVASVLDPDVLLSVVSGLTTINTERVHASPVDPELVFDALENERNAGRLPDAVSSSAVRYQASTQFPGYLEKIESNGHRITGHFKNGQFIAVDELES